MNRKIFGIAAAIGTALVTHGALLAASGAAEARQQSNGAARSSGAKLGEFAIRNFARMTTRLGTNTITADLSGGSLVVESPQYTMSAPRIEMTAKKGGQPVRYKVVSANASGGVRIVTRDAAANRTTVVTSNSAVYAATTNAKDLGIINLRGNVTSETREPDLQMNGDSFVADTQMKTFDVRAESGTATGTL